MFDFYDSNYSDEFKQRLQDARCKKKFSQQDFADCLEDNDRSRVANWESKKSTTVPKTQGYPWHLQNFRTLIPIIFLVFQP